jgi:hypothetical protein
MGLRGLLYGDLYLYLLLRIFSALLLSVLRFGMVFLSVLTNAGIVPEIGHGSFFSRYNRCQAMNLLKIPRY